MHARGDDAMTTKPETPPTEAELRELEYWELGIGPSSVTLRLIRAYRRVREIAAERCDIERTNAELCEQLRQLREAGQALRDCGHSMAKQIRCQCAELERPCLLHLYHTAQAAWDRLTEGKEQP